MKQKLQDKIRYYKEQERKTTRRFIREMKRLDRDDIIRIQRRIEVYEELIDIINQEKC